MSTKQLEPVDDYDGDKAANGENLLSLKILGGDDGRLNTPSSGLGNRRIDLV